MISRTASIGLAAASAIAFFYAPSFAGRHAGAVRVLCAAGAFAGIAIAMQSKSGKTLADELIEETRPTPPHARIDEESSLPPAPLDPTPGVPALRGWFLDPTNGSVVRRRNFLGDEYGATIDLQNDSATARGVDVAIVVTETDIRAGAPARTSFGRVFLEAGERRRLELTLTMQTQVIVTLPSVDAVAELEVDGKVVDRVAFFLR